jgi:hypothetical protein
LSFCRLLGNDALSLVLLALIHPIGSVSLHRETESESERRSAIARAVGFCEADVDYCASLFDSYSVKELQILDHKLLRRILESRFLTLSTEDSLLRVLISLGSSFSEFFDCIEISFLSAEGIGLFVDGLGFEHLNAWIWGKVCDRLKSVTRVPAVCDRVAFPCESTILRRLPSVLSRFCGHGWTLSYRGSQHGFRAVDFHGKCNSQSNTVTLIDTTTGCIFGGFTPIGWDSSSGWKEDPTKQSFLFRIKDHRNSEPRTFVLSSSSYAIFCHSSYGPIFGNGHNLCVVDSCHQNKGSYTNLGKNYVNDTGLDGTQVFTGEQYFTVREIEVFSITG